MAYIVSTATTPINFADYHADSLKPGQLPQVRRKVTIQGGANMPDKTLHTPRGVVTRVSDSDLAFLVGDPNFNKMVKDGFMQIIADERDLDDAARDMTAKDRSAPLTPADFRQTDGTKKDGRIERTGRVVEEILN